MKRALLALAVTGVLLPVAALLVLHYAFDPNAYKVAIETAFHTRTGHGLSLEGPLQLHFIPSLGIDASAVAVRATQQNSPLIAVRRVELRVAWLPLLRRGVHIESLRVEGLELNLGRAADGHGNWEALLTAFSAPSEAGGVQLTGVDEILLKQASVGFNDELRPASYRLSTVDLTATTLLIGRGYRVRLAGRPQLDGRTWPPFVLSSRLRYGSDPIQVNLNDVALTWDRLQIKGEIEGQFKAAFAGHGKLTFELPDVPGFTRALGLSARLPEGFQRLAGTLRVTATPTQIDLPMLKLMVDDSTVNGGVVLLPQIRFDLRADRIDWGRYLPAGATSTPVTATPVAAASPVDWLDRVRALGIQGQLTVAEQRYGAYRLAGTTLRFVPTTLGRR